MAEYAETAVLVEVMNEDPARAATRLREFTRAELVALADHLDTLGGLITAELNYRDC